MPNDLTPARLRALIAAARNDKTGWCECCSQVIGADAISLMAYMDEHAPALADALEKAELLEWALANCYIAGPTAWEDGKQIDAAEIDSIDALRAAKEAADAKA